MFFRNEKIEDVVLSSAPHVNTHQPLPISHFIADQEYIPYVNPNLLFVATTTNRSQGESVMNIYVIDSVSGSILYQTFHHQASGPLHMVQGDNWLTYQYWNTKLSRNELCTLELFSSSLSRMNLVALGQTYLIDFEVNGMAVTKTLFGVTSKEILFATRTGNVLGILQLFFSARRPHLSNFTNQHREMFLVPYDPRVIPHPSNYLSSNRTILGVKHIITAQAHVESSSLIFSYGHDNFFTIVCPSKSFDFLESDFNYIGLFLTVVVVSIATIVLRCLAVRKELHTTWK